MSHGLGRDGWPSDATVLRSRDADIERLTAENEALLEALSRVVEVWPNHKKAPGWVSRWLAAFDNAKALVQKARKP